MGSLVSFAFREDRFHISFQTMNMSFISVLFAFIVSVVYSMSTVQKNPDSVFANEVEEAKLKRELENLVKSLDTDQLELLETILGKEDANDESKEFDMISAELKEMGMDEEDIEDLRMLAEMMHGFLSQIPALATKLELEKEYDLLDNVQLYLLGLPNKLGPLGYIALHNVMEELQDEVDGEIVDIKVEPVLTPTTTTPAAETAQTFRKKRATPLDQVLRFRRNA